MVFDHNISCFVSLKRQTRQKLSNTIIIHMMPKIPITSWSQGSVVSVQFRAFKASCKQLLLGLCRATEIRENKQALTRDLEIG